MPRYIAMVPVYIGAKDESQMRAKLRFLVQRVKKFDESLPTFSHCFIPQIGFEVDYAIEVLQVKVDETGNNGEIKAKFHVYPDHTLKFDTKSKTYAVDNCSGYELTLHSKAQRDALREDHFPYSDHLGVCSNVSGVGERFV